MPLYIFVLVVASAVAHATWNLLAKRLPNRLETFALINGTLFVIGLLALLITGLPATGAIVFIGISVCIHLAYNTLLLNTYTHGDLSQGYPIARGLAPPLVALGAFIFLSQQLNAFQIVGIAIAVGGLAFTISTPEGLWHQPRKGLAFALATGVSVAAYSVVDGIGVRHTQDALSYAALLMGTEGLIVAVAAALLARRASNHGDVGTRLAATFGGVLSFGAYAAVLYAQQHSSLAEVSALRETSVVIGALLGTFLLKEGNRRRRVTGAVILTVGIAVLLLA